MALLHDFDMAIAAAENTSGGYKTSKGIYYNYLSNDAWQTHLCNMSNEHKNQFGGGSGGELEEKNGRPPKMASFASSSRMIYLLAKKAPGFTFEKKLSTTVGGVANLDGYLDLPDRHIYAEAKCREPYSHVTEQIIKQNYRSIYAYLQEKMPDVFSCSMEDIPEKEGSAPKRNMQVTFFCKGIPVAYFDIKQMICHLLAVATQALKTPDGKPILFLYLLYDPSELQMNGKNEILRIHSETCKTANDFDFKTMFGHIVDFLRQQKDFRTEEAEAAALKNAFSFRLCDQNSFPVFLE